MGTCPQARARDSSNVAFLLAADKPIMETVSHLSTPAMNAHDHRRDSTMTSDQFLKMEDLHSSASPSPSFDPQDTSPAPDASQASPPPVIVQSKPAKKRKSWGQELPEPKTHLPPRKRAKTDDEEEQRRIERIKRNRAAAHNSRERKRQETETLAVALARANAELEAYRRLHGPLPANIQLPDVQLSSDMVDTPAPSLVESHGTAEAAPSPSSPATHMFHLHQDQHIKQEPLDHPFPSTIPPAFETSHLDSKTTLSPLDQTQHSAVSVEPSEQHQQHPFKDPASKDVNFAQLLLGGSLPAPHDGSDPDLLQDSPGRHLEPFAFSDGAYDTSFNPPLDFSFDDFIHDDSATVAVDGHGAA